MAKKFAFLFPGQGSQSVGMLDAFAQNDSTSDIYQECVTCADSALGEDLSGLIAQGPQDNLNLTVNTQPAMLLSAVVAYRAWVAKGGPSPAMVAGHSLGEYSALVAAGGLPLDQAVRLVRIRAQAMQDAVPVGEGGMAAILGLSDADVIELCQQITHEGALVEPVNFNAPAQVVVAGTVTGIEKICIAAKGKGAKRAVPLTVSAPFHSSLLKPAASTLQQALEKHPLTDLQIPVVTNVDVRVETSAQALSDALVRQAYSPVRWVESIQKMEQEGIELFVECGPGKVLAGLVKRICDVPVMNISNPDQIQDVLNAI
ncbi:MAG: ACP S-malonyltransferase [Limnobacter sp.]|nr:ACP S-malonyltransferase [Limnobacter sp.]